jgi:hypothetical protein
VKGSWKSGQEPAFPPKSKGAFPKTEVLGKPRGSGNFPYRMFPTPRDKGFLGYTRNRKKMQGVFKKIQDK